MVEAVAPMAPGPDEIKYEPLALCAAPEICAEPQAWSMRILPAMSGDQAASADWVTAGVPTAKLAAPRPALITLRARPGPVPSSMSIEADQPLPSCQV